ncbi:MAG: rifampicin phosphotransferase [Actinomycetota bacterium]|nr:rifampicin phosphotransferase [Actinomycetota bacterium]
MTTLAWSPPAKGDWRGLHDHFPRALTPEYQRLLATGMAEGEADYFARYGLPARTLQPAFVHGRVFVTAAPLVGPATNRVPPGPLLWLAVRLVPAFRRRAAAARRTLAERPWLAEAVHWYDVERPAWQARNHSLDAVEPAALADDDLITHLRAVRALVEAGFRDHFRLHGADLIPTSLFLTRAADWGIDPVDAAALLVGSSPASRGDGELPVWRLVSGYDLDERCACELPTRTVAVGALMEPNEHMEAKLRSQVPADDRAEWHDRLADARATYGLRDDNGLYTVAWPVGLLRRVMLEAGRRLAARGILEDAAHAVELTVEELATALAGPAEPSTGPDAAARLAARRRMSAARAPASLGPAWDLPLGMLPPAMRLITRALLTLRDLGVTPPGERAPLSGVGIGAATVTGRACVATDPAEALARFEPGDVLVTAGTCPAWNALLAHAAGVVTEEGGPMSHAAVIARELGLPAVIGAADAMQLVPDGATVELDPRAGTVRVVN